MLYFTGDTHSTIDWDKIRSFAKENIAQPGDTLFIAGDFGGCWDNGLMDMNVLDFYSQLPFDVCFIDGNHENFNILYNYPVVKYHGGKVHRLRPNLYHLMRGEIFEFEGKKLLAMGGAASTDKEHREENISWWEEEVPSKAQREHCFENLEKNNFNVDIVLTHEMPSSLVPEMQYIIFGSKSLYTSTRLLNPHEYSNWLEDIIHSAIEYKIWIFGHYHRDSKVNNKDFVLYNNVCKLVEEDNQLDLELVIN